MSAGGDAGQKGPAVSAQEAQMQAIMQQARVTVRTHKTKNITLQWSDLTCVHCTVMSRFSWKFQNSFCCQIASLVFFHLCILICVLTHAAMIFGKSPLPSHVVISVPIFLILFLIFSFLCSACHARTHRSNGFDRQTRPSGAYLTLKANTVSESIKISCQTFDRCPVFCEQN